MSNRIKQMLLTFIPCFAFWLLLTMSVSVRELIYGLIVCLAAAWFSSGFYAQQSEAVGRMYHPWRVIKLVFYLVFILGWEIVKANWSTAKAVLLNKPLKQAIIKVPVEGLEDDYALALLADSITLTPGTITIDVATEADGSTCMYVQWLIMETEDRVEAGEMIKGRMEKWIRRVCK